MSNRWVSNTSPLILLNKIRHLKLLTDLCDELIIPKAVTNELRYSESERSKWEIILAASKKLNTLGGSLTIHPGVAGWDLGTGESEVISYAIDHPGCEVILDDLEARKCAHTFGIPLRGTVGIILLAKKKNIISKASPLIESLINSGLRFDTDWITKALELVNERLEIK